MRKITFNDIESAQIINLYLSGMSCKLIGKQFRCSKQTINAFIKSNNIKIRDKYHCGQKYKIDENIFETIDNHEKAYWLGMLAGDGCVNKRGELSLSLQQKDIQHIILFKNFLKSEHPIRISKSVKNSKESISSYLYVSNYKITQNLIKLNIIPNKTKFMEFPNIDDKYLPSYMLGLVDSDGCFTIKRGKALGFSFVGPTEFVEKFQNILIKECGVSRTKLEAQKKTSFIRIVAYGGYKNIFKIVKFLYEKSPVHLARKKNIAINFLLTKFPNDEWLKKHAQHDDETFSLLQDS